jgi:lysozyme
MNKLIRYASACATAVTLAGSIAVLGAGSASAATVRPADLGMCKFTGAQPELKEGDRGTDVVQAQCELNFASLHYNGVGLSEDGIFGAQTKGWTEAFQQCAGLTVDGIIGPQTWAMLNFYADQDGACNDRTVTQ